MVSQLAHRGIKDPWVLWALGQVPREMFLDPEKASQAYYDGPVSIGRGQTISQPYMVAEMLQALKLSPDDRVLEVGAGSGYVAALLSLLSAKVVALERIPELAMSARERLAQLGYKAQIECADGTLGWPKQAPYNAILVSAAAPRIPTRLCEQLAPGGRLVIPVGGENQQRLRRITLREHGLAEERLSTVRFVPLIGADGWD